MAKIKKPPQTQCLWVFIGTGDERIELPLKVLETLVIPFDQAPTSKNRPTIYITAFICCQPETESLPARLRVARNHPPLQEHSSLPYKYDLIHLMQQLRGHLPVPDSVYQAVEGIAGHKVLADDRVIFLPGYLFMGDAEAVGIE